MAYIDEFDGLEYCIQENIEYLKENIRIIRDFTTFL